MSSTQTVRFYRDSDGPKTLRIETDGGVIDIQVGLTDEGGLLVTRVDVTADDATRGGDAQGRVWLIDGSGRRLVRVADEEKDVAEAEQRQSVGSRNGYWSLVVTAPVDDAVAEHIAGGIARGETQGPYVHGYDDEQE